MIEEKELFQKYKQQKLSRIIDSRYSFFNFFLEHNRILGFIAPEDCDRAVGLYRQHASRLSWTTLGAFAVSLVGARLLRPARLQGQFYFSLALVKYAVVPISIYGVVREYGCKDIEASLIELIEKYNFGPQHFEQAFRVFERAENAGRLHELLEQQEKFDWTGVPDLPPRISSE